MDRNPSRHTSRNGGTGPRRAWRVRHAFLASLLLATSCGRLASLPAIDTAGAPNDLRELGNQTYRISWGDRVEVKFFTHPELNELQVIRPDGYLSIQLLGDIRAAGKTPVELRNDIIIASKDILRDAQVTVFVREMKSLTALVGGEVGAPRLVIIDHPTTVLEAIFMAGGPRPGTAALDSVVVLRLQSAEDTKKQGGEGEKEQGIYVEYKVNGRKMVRKAYLYNLATPLSGRPTPPMYVQPQDIVFVPQTRIVKLNTWIDQYFRHVVPSASVVRTGDDIQSQYGIRFRR